MITNGGKDVIKKYFGGQAPRIGESIALGVGAVAANVNDTKLTYEAGRAQITSTASDLANNRIVFKATIVPGTIREIYEVGLYQNVLSANRSKIISLFTGRSPWTAGTLVATNARVNSQTLQVTAAANATTTASVSGLAQDLSAFVGSDGIALALNASANVSQVKLRLGASATSYFEFTFATPAAGFNALRANLAAATQTGAPSWASINYAELRVTASAGGTANVFLESLSIEDNTTPVDNILVVRNVLTTPVVVDPVIPTDIELSLGITV